MRGVGYSTTERSRLDGGSGRGLSGIATCTATVFFFSSLFLGHASAFILQNQQHQLYHSSLMMSFHLNAVSKPRDISAEPSLSSWYRKIQLLKQPWKKQKTQHKQQQLSHSSAGRAERSSSSSSSSEQVLQIHKNLEFMGSSTPVDDKVDNEHQQQQKLVEITTLDDFKEYWYGTRTRTTFSRDDNDDGGGGDHNNRDFVRLIQNVIKGDTQIIGSKTNHDFIHPVVQLVHERRRRLRLRRHKEQQRRIKNRLQWLDMNNDDDDDNDSCSSNPKTDGCKVALVIEGGGMRGCVSAGMACAIHYLGLEDTIDVVYGSSAGAVVGAYFCSRQIPWYGPEVYFDQLTEQTAGRNFIDLKRLLRSLGLGLIDPRLFKDVLTRPDNGKPLLNLHYLLQNTMQGSKPLDWNAFEERQATQPLRVVATGLRSERPVILDRKSGHLDSLKDLCNALHASCLLPGIAGPVMNTLKDPHLHTESMNDDTSSSSKTKPLYVIQNGQTDEDYEPLCDAILSSPIPYDLAHEEGATHVIVLRSSPDGTNVMDGNTAKTFFESLILRRFFRRKNKLPDMFQKLQIEQHHQRKYAESILELNARAQPQSTVGQEDSSDNVHRRHTMTIALEPGTEAVSHLETSREAIFEGVRRGFARAYDALVYDPTHRGRGYEVAMKCFPDEILDYDPCDFTFNTTGGQPQESNTDFVSYRVPLMSAFQQFLHREGTVPKAWMENGVYQDIQELIGYE
jgi:predicted acylesterase/phospholipase RssA